MFSWKRKILSAEGNDKKGKRIKYVVNEGIDNPLGKYNAGSKARKDAEKILESDDFNIIYANTNYGVKESRILKPLQYYEYLKNYFKWKKIVKQLSSGDIIVIQYPLNNITLFFNKILKKINKKNVLTIALIHDLDSLRITDNMKPLYKRRVINMDKVTLNLYQKIIVHNEEMKKYLMQYINKDKLYILGIFDYLLDEEVKSIKRKKDDSIVIAGNLSSTKANYLKKLSDANKLKINLYGKGLDFVLPNNVKYKGTFLPDVIVGKIDGGYGLVWDGNDIDNCSGVYGEYLKYNNPHKASLYIVSQLPLIVPSTSAISKFVLKNKIGLTIDDIKDIDKKINQLTDENYIEMQKNIRKLSKKLLSGFYLKNVVNEIINDWR